MAAVIQGTMSVPRVTATTLAEYLTANGSGKIDCVRDQIRIYGQEYRPGPAFYQDFKGAVVHGRETGADHLAMQRVISAQHDPARRKHYSALAEHWLALTDLHLPLVAHARTEWVTSRLVVGIQPDFAMTDPKGQLFTVKLWLKDRELGEDAVRALHWLFKRYMDDICPGATPLVVDVRREKVHRPSRRPWKGGFEALLENEAASLAGLWERLAAAA